MQSIYELVKSKVTAAQFSMLENFYNNKDVIVTGGASFIGSNLVDLLLQFKANVKIVDDFSSGSLQNLLHKNGLDVVPGDLRNLDFTHK